MTGRQMVDLLKKCVNKKLDRIQKEEPKWIGGCGFVHPSKKLYVEIFLKRGMIYSNRSTHYAYRFKIFTDGKWEVISKDNLIKHIDNK